MREKQWGMNAGQWLEETGGFKDRAESQGASSSLKTELGRMRQPAKNTEGGRKQYSEGHGGQLTQSLQTSDTEGWK